MKASLHAMAVIIGVVGMLIGAASLHHGAVAIATVIVSGCFSIQNLVLAAKAANEE